MKSSYQLVDFFLHFAFNIFYHNADKLSLLVLFNSGLSSPPHSRLKQKKTHVEKKHHYAA